MIKGSRATVQRQFDNFLFQHKLTQAGHGSLNQLGVFRDLNPLCFGPTTRRTRTSTVSLTLSVMPSCTYF